MRCSVYIATSLDGFIARANGSFDFLDLADVANVDYGYNAFWSTLDAIVIGRGTYDTVLEMPEWPYEGKRVIVMTHRPQPPRRDEELVSTTAAELAARLAREGVHRAYIDGGVIIRQFLDADLIDDLTLSVIPILLGAGIPLFAPSQHPVDLRLVLEESRSWPTGVVQSRYSRERGTSSATS